MTQVSVCQSHSQSKLHSVLPPPPPPFSRGGGVEPPTKFKEKGRLTGPQLLEGCCWETVAGDFFSGEGGGGVQLSHNEILNIC